MHGPTYMKFKKNVAAILLLLFMVLISLVPVINLLYFYISTFRSMCAVPNMAVFCSSLTSCFPGMLLTYFLNDFENSYYYYYYYYYYIGWMMMVEVVVNLNLCLIVQRVHDVRLDIL